MTVINNIDNKIFSFNGINYYKNFMPLVVGDKVRILNVYDSSIELTDFPTLYSEFTVDGNTFANVADLQTALLPVIYTRESLNSLNEISVLGSIVGDSLVDVDNTGVTDCSSDIKTAISLITGDFLYIRFGQGTFLLESSLGDLSRFKSITIEGFNSILKPSFSDNKDLFDIYSDFATNGFFIKKVKITGLDFDFSLCSILLDKSAIKINKVLGSVNVSYSNFFNFKGYDNKAIEMLNVGNSPDHPDNNTNNGFKISNCDFYNEKEVSTVNYDYDNNNTFGKCIVIGADNSDASEYWNIISCGFINIHKAVIQKSGANGVMSNCSIQYCNPVPTGGSVENGVVEVLPTTDNDGKTTISNCKFNHNWGTSIRLSYTASDRPTIISNNQFLANNYLPIKIIDCDRIKIKDNCFDRALRGVGLNLPPFVVNRYIIILNSNASMVQNNDFFNSADFAVAYSGTSKDNIVTGNLYVNTITTFTSLTDGVLNNIVKNNIQTT